MRGAEAARWRDWLARRAAGEPLAYLFGEKEFYGLALAVSPAVLVPRPETELLVEWAVGLLQGRPAGAAVVDLGTGSGAIALAVKHACPACVVSASDASREALAVAATNGRRLRLEVELVEGDWWQPFAGRRFDVAVANPPYVAAGDPHLQALRHEPSAALSPGADGLAALARIVADAAPHLLPGGWLLLEQGFEQGPAVAALLGDAGFARVATHADLAGLPRTTGGQRP